MATIDERELDVILAVAALVDVAGMYPAITVATRAAQTAAQCRAADILRGFEREADS